MAKGKAPANKGLKSPWKYTEEHVGKICELIQAYCDKPFTREDSITQFPSIAAFCFENSIPKDILFRNETLCEYRKRIELKREMIIERMMFSGHVPAACIFALKQLGWRDRMDVELEGGPKLLETLKAIQTPWYKKPVDAKKGI
jgi:hypothetical protein